MPVVRRPFSLEGELVTLAACNGRGWLMKGEGKKNDWVTVDPVTKEAGY